MCVLIAGLGVRLASPREPSYQGKALSEWIVPFCQQTPKGLNAPGGPQYLEEMQPVRHAVAAMGTNALPWLIARVKHRESRLHRMLRQWGDKQPLRVFKLTDPQVGRIRAIRSLSVLGPLAEPAIPSLAPAVVDPAVSTHAIYALSKIGPNGMRALLDQWTSANRVAHMEIGMSVISFQPQGPRVFGLNTDGTNTLPDDILVTAYRRMAQELPWFRMTAIEQLGRLAITDSNAALGLLPVLEDKQGPIRQMAIRALANATNESDLVLPALTNLLADPDPGTRMAAVVTLRNFGYKAEFQPSFGNPAFRTYTPDGFTPFSPEFRRPGTNRLGLPGGAVPAQTNAVQ
jgi:hypothetical protein